MKPSAIIRACRHTPECEVILPSGTFRCCSDCWNAAVRRRKQLRREELAARPRCCICSRGAGRYEVPTTPAPSLLCGRCLNRAQAAHRARVGSNIAAALGVEWTRAYLEQLCRAPQQKPRRRP